MRAEYVDARVDEDVIRTVDPRWRGSCIRRRPGVGPHASNERGGDSLPQGLAFAAWGPACAGGAGAARCLWLREENQDADRGSTRPRDPAMLAATIIGRATGEIPESDVAGRCGLARRAGGVNGGPARAKSLTAERRAEIARAAAKARWGERAAAAAVEK